MLNLVVTILKRCFLTFTMCVYVQLFYIFKLHISSILQDSICIFSCSMLFVNTHTIYYICYILIYATTIFIYLLMMDIKITSNFHFYKSYGCEVLIHRLWKRWLRIHTQEKKLRGCRDCISTLNLMVSNCSLKLYQLRLPTEEYKSYLC